MSALEPIVLALPDTDCLSGTSPQMRAVLRCVATSRPVIAVIGATSRDEHAALAQANALPVHADEAVQAWVRTHPARRAAAALADALRAAGIPAPVLDAGEIGPTVRGPVLDAEPASVRAGAVFEALGVQSVVIVAGGSGRTEDGRPAIVGDGSALLTALFLGDRLALEVCVLGRDGDADGKVTRACIGAREAPAAGIPFVSVERRAELFARRRRVPFRIVRADLTPAGLFDPERFAEPSAPDEAQSPRPQRAGTCLTRAG